MTFSLLRASRHPFATLAFTGATALVAFLLIGLGAGCSAGGDGELTSTSDPDAARRSSDEASNDAQIASDASTGNPLRIKCSGSTSTYTCCHTSGFQGARPICVDGKPECPDQQYADLSFCEFRDN